MKLVQFENDLFGLLEHSNDGIKIGYGTRTEMVSYMLEIVGVSGTELLNAISQFEEKNHNVALFGVNRTCIFTCNEDVTRFTPIRKTKGVA